MNKQIIVILIFISALSLFLNIYRQSNAPPCLNADEAAFGYNSYSILKTGKDEYGNFLPLRLKSFGDYKMPLYSYLSIPFIAISGLNEGSVRALNSFVAFLFPITIFFLSREIFKNMTVSLLASFLSSVSLGLHIVGRHAHEAYLTTFLISLALLFLIKTLKNQSIRNTLLFFLFISLALFSYHPSRLFAFFFLGVALITQIFKKINKKLFILIFVFVLGAFMLTDVIYNPTRVKNLLFFNNQGFSLNINELKTEGGIKLFYNEYAQGIKEIVFQHLNYYSPQFFISNGDENPRFGFNGASLMTPIEYLFIFIGLYYLFKNKQSYRYLLTGLFIIAPLTASLSWADISLTRSLFFLVPSIIISAYGLFNFLNSFFKYKKSLVILSGSIGVIFLFFLGISWDSYIFHYPKKALTIKSWQCGYKELAQYIKDNYEKFDNFNITKKNGQPYIFLLFYLNYAPQKYQKQAVLSIPDQYGFGQIESFDKFNFSFKDPRNLKNEVNIGFPDDFNFYENDNQVDLSRIKKIKVGTEDMFWIYENPTKKNKD
ncbi:MAG: glycosyltransferase family 39 protein [Candidatus Roizmanbacteria bacterium]|nr:MAG: glycosyltransferase family 39 protein [Candidatus Roizmanbacteria bacterium]